MACESKTTTDEKPAMRPFPVNPDPPSTYLLPAESMKTMHLPEGYRVELVASEPMIEEPVAIVWDGDGRMDGGAIMHRSC